MQKLEKRSETNANSTQVKKVKAIFNEMADEYDHLTDLWYRYTFNNIDHVLSSELQPSLRRNGNTPVALDLGCGTGIQSLRLASMGYRVIAVDIADALVQIAKKKLYRAGHNEADFLFADVQSLPFEDNIADCVNCCGPTLSFVPRWRLALAEISRCLRPGGKLLLEVEGKWNLDLFWEIISAVGFNFLGFDEPLSTGLEHLLPPWNMGHTVDYSFKKESGETVSMPLKLFTSGELDKELKNVGLMQDKRWGLHMVTNIIPSTVLHDSKPSNRLKKIFNRLAWVEKHIYCNWPFNSFACSILVLAHKNKT